MRFAIALLAAALVVGAAIFALISLRQTMALLLLIGFLVFVLVVSWVSIQIWRVRLIGDAVLVSADTLPQLQAVVDVVKHRLDYTRPIDVFVVDKISRVLAGGSAPITLTTLFGKHILVVEGDALGNPADDGDRQQLVFLLATYVGALKVRYQQWWLPVLMVLQCTGMPFLVTLFILPWYRATVYSGDRIAYACCGDLDVSLQAVYRSIVGKSVATHLQAEGLTGQAMMARRRFVLRLAQMLRATPHATNRYLDLIAFMRDFDQPAFDGHQAALGTGDRETTQVLNKLAGRRTHPTAPLISMVIVAVLLAGAVLGGIVLPYSPIAQVIQALETHHYPPPSYPDPRPAETDTPSADPTSPAPTMSAEAEQLAGYAPAGMNDCDEETASGNAVNAMVTVLCRSTSASMPSFLWLFAFTSKNELEAASRTLRGSSVVPNGCAKDVSSPTTWGPKYSSKSYGSLACFRDSSGDATVLWGRNSTLVLAEASDSSWTLKKLYTWWTDDGPNLG
jgi:hypothetical protein